MPYRRLSQSQGGTLSCALCPTRTIYLTVYPHWRYLGVSQLTVELLIIRHGEAGNRSTSVSKDREPGLTASGRKKMEDVAYSINGLKLVIDEIATSPLTRARETAEIVAAC